MEPSRVPASRPEPARLVVAIDGPAGSGKSSVARAVAERLGLRYLDTGAMYRALTWWVLEQGLDPAVDRDAVRDRARDLPLEMALDPADATVRVDGADVTREIRETRISRAVSAVATNLGVREELVGRQRAVARQGGVVIEGRDITTVVAPDAAVRVLLTADDQARLARRALDVHGTSDPDAVAATRDEVLRRDADDATVAAFQHAAPGVVVVDSSVLTLGETVEAVLSLVELAAVGSPR
jgi:cytidylate kinase